MCKLSDLSTKTSFSITPPFSKLSNSVKSLFIILNLKTLYDSFDIDVMPPIL